MDTPPTDQEIKANALRHAGNTWRRFVAYKRRFVKKFGSSASEPRGSAFFNNRLLEDTFARTDDPNSLPHGKLMEERQRMATPIMDFRSRLNDPSKYDEIYATSLGRRMPGYAVEVSRAMSASTKVHEKDSIRTFVTKVK